jgi:2-isopropylmalate synthase
MHVHAIARATSSYEHIAPEAVGNERRILVSELSGRSNIKAVVGDNAAAADDPALMDRILARVVELENQGYQFEAAQGSFDLLVKKVAGTYRPHFERIHFRVNVEADAPDNVVTEATVKLGIDGPGKDKTVQHEVAEGDGPVNALDAALRKALHTHFPNLSGMQLVDYKVRVINTEAGTAAGVRVVIESRDDDEVWGTVGVSENIIEASWIALVDSFEYKLYKDEGQKSSGGRAKAVPVSG